MDVSGWGDLAYGIVLFACTQALTPGRVLLFAFFSLMAAVVLSSLRVFYHSFTFFLGNAEEFAATASELVVSFMVYPGSIFEGPASIFLHSLAPAALIAYIPADLFRSFDPGRMLAVSAADLLIVLVAALTFRLGLRAYESGNRMGARL
jgi:ABC-2 type transport system permease protein